MAEPAVWGSDDGPVVAMDLDDRDRLLLASQHTPHPGRVYDYYLGGHANYEVDRVFAKKRMAAYPDLQWLAWQNRQCLRRMVRYLISQGVRQFVDLGAGLPTQGNVHEIADQGAPGECAVVYVDQDPIAFAMSLIELEKQGVTGRHGAVCGDVADAARVWPAVLSTGLIDPDQPIGLLMVAVIPFVLDDRDPMGMTRFYRDQLGPGSFLALTHGTLDGMSDGQRAQLRATIDRYDETTASATLRSKATILELFGGWPLVDPGLVWTPLWLQDGDEADEPERDPARSSVLAGMARNPG